jgi:hypothetical protein
MCQNIFVLLCQIVDRTSNLLALADKRKADHGEHFIAFKAVSNPFLPEYSHHIPTNYIAGFLHMYCPLSPLRKKEEKNKKERERGDERTKKKKNKRKRKGMVENKRIKRDIRV